MRISDWSSDVCSSDLLGDLPFSVEGLDTLFIDGRVVAVVDGLDLEDMPEESISLLKSGKASVKAIPVGKRHELHRDAICSAAVRVARSEEHTSELQSLMRSSYAVFCLNKKTNTTDNNYI